jgi:glutamate synthase (NADPH/NADH) large chain
MFAFSSEICGLDAVIPDRTKQRFSTHAPGYRHCGSGSPGGKDMSSNRPITPSTLSVKDLPWQIRWNKDRCTLCGSCTAVCPVNAIELAVFRKRNIGCPPGHWETTERSSNEYRHLLRHPPENRSRYACIGCAMCTMVCPNDAICPVPNRRGGQAEIPHQPRAGSPGAGADAATSRAVLDQIKFIRISMLTDPALDAGRHEFELRTLLGRVLPRKTT